MIINWIKTLPAKLHHWWLSRGRWKMAFFTAVFAWASYNYRHPILALALGLALLDYIVEHRGNWLLRVLMSWMLANVVVFALTGAL